MRPTGAVRVPAQARDVVSRAARADHGVRRRRVRDQSLSSPTHFTSGIGPLPAGAANAIRSNAKLSERTPAGPLSSRASSGSAPRVGRAGLEVGQLAALVGALELGVAVGAALLVGAFAGIALHRDLDERL